MYTGRPSQSTPPGLLGTPCSVILPVHLVPFSLGLSALLTNKYLPWPQCLIWARDSIIACDGRRVKLSGHRGPLLGKEQFFRRSRTWQWQDSMALAARKKSLTKARLHDDRSWCLVRRQPS